VRRPVDKLLEDITLAADVAQEIVDRGRDHFEADLVTQFGAEVVVGRMATPHGRVWNTLSRDIPRLRAAIQRYREGGATGG
jgi:hypothetical protein